MSEHLDFQTDFLDKNTSPKKVSSTRKSNAANKDSGTQSYNWKKILIIGGVILFFGWIIFSGDNSTSNTNTGNYMPPASINDDSVVVGEYTCSRYHYNQAVSLDPNESESQITSAQNSLEYQANELERLQNEMESSYVNEYSSQWEIDQYNEMVDEYNSKLSAYKRNAVSFNLRIDRYNAQIATYNNYLMNNCIPNR